MCIYLLNKEGKSVVVLEVLAMSAVVKEFSLGSVIRFPDPSSNLSPPKVQTSLLLFFPCSLHVLPPNLVLKLQ